MRGKKKKSQMNVLEKEDENRRERSGRKKK